MHGEGETSFEFWRAGGVPMTFLTIPHPQSWLFKPGLGLGAGLRFRQRGRGALAARGGLITGFAATVWATLVRSIQPPGGVEGLQRGIHFCNQGCERFGEWGGGGWHTFLSTINPKRVSRGVAVTGREGTLRWHSQSGWKGSMQSARKTMPRRVPCASSRCPCPSRPTRNR